ncbi:acyl-CoA dehydrogenase family protein [Erythrobacter sp.]|uniref:acyl-CoA dehydrogenase family protein n=1 Tax=Erythrobacter sp. TaxID=1042 RepID=UPI002EADF244|nr:acyl-CoA dehydrogenase family protein [Erythrobacter sp.]
MNFDWTEDQELFRDTVERFLTGRDIGARRTQQAYETGIDRARWQATAELGLTALAVPEDNGGLGGGMFDMIGVAETFGRRLSADQWLENAALPGLLAGLAGEGADWIDEMVAGERIVAVAFAEPDRRYALTPSATVLKRQGDGYTLSGTKTLVLGGMAADTLLVTATMDGASVLLACDAVSEGVDRRGYRIVDGSLAAEIAFREVALPTSAIVSRDWSGVRRAFDRAALLAAAELVGLGDRMLDDTLAYVREREQFGQPIGKFQALQHRLVDAYALGDQSRSMLYRAGIEADKADCSTAIAGAKSLIGENTLTIGRDAIQMHGGMGTTEEMEVGHAHKRSLLLAQLFGDARANLATYAKEAA